ncbi:MAG: hypothetical protein ACRDZ8_05905 [Acidimicrobiales bacterium]
MEDAPEWDDRPRRRGQPLRASGPPIDEGPLRRDEPDPEGEAAIYATLSMDNDPVADDPGNRPGRLKLRRRAQDSR